MIKRKVKEENGFAASDALIAVLIIALFTGIIATIIYNIYLSNSSIKRMGTATGYITKIFENLDKRYYDDTTVEGLATYFNENGTQFNIDKNQINISSNNENETAITIGVSDSEQYKINIYIEYYNKTEGNKDKLDMVKQLTVTVGYKLGNKNQEITMNRVKSREKLVAPNKPDIALLEEQTKKVVNPVKNINGKWKVCDERDATWYNYEGGYWAAAVVSDEKLEINTEINIDDYLTDGNIYVWIPRFAYDEKTSSIEFLYSKTNNYIDDIGDYNVLSELEDTFVVSTEFKIDDKDSIGIWVNNTSGDAYTNLNSIYEMEQEIW